MTDLGLVLGPRSRLMTGTDLREWARHWYGDGLVHNSHLWSWCSPRDYWLGRHCDYGKHRSRSRPSRYADMQHEFATTKRDSSDRKCYPPADESALRTHVFKNAM